MKRQRRTNIVLAIAAVTVLAVAVWIFLNRKDSADHLAESQQASPSSPADSSSSGTAAVSAAKSPTAKRTLSAKDFDEILAASLAALEREPDEAQVRSTLEQLRTALLQLDPFVATASVSQFIDSGKDATTGLDFEVGEGGFLKSPNSLRVALLEYLAQASPSGAGQLAKTILESPTTADEWAVSLRNYARAFRGTDTTPFLRSKVEEMLAIDDWLEKPSPGFFEAFDVFVYTESTQSVPKLAEFFEDPDRRDLSHAAYLTFDRLTLRRPAAMFEQLLESNELQQTKGPMVANFFARADIRDGQQRALVEQYLLSEDRTDAELAAFAGIYPNNNLMISQNLLTTAPTLARQDLVAHDREASTIVEKWLNDPQFERIKPHLQTMHNRLVTFMRQAGASQESP